MKTLTQNKQFNIFQILTSILILLWSYTTISKLSNLGRFANEMHNQSFDADFANLLIRAVPFVEICTIILLLFNKSKMFGLACSLILLTVFTIYIILVLFNFYDHVPCSCGGVLRSMTWNTHLWFNLFFIFLNVLALLLGRRMGIQADKEIKI